MADPVNVAPVPEAPPAPIAAPVPAAASSSDPFAVDEARIATFSPEQRGVLDEWKKRASEEIQKSSKTYEEKYKPHAEKATALDNLIKVPAFQKWWTDYQQQAMQGQAQPQKQAIAQSQPQDFATPQEWSEAILDASNGQPAKLQSIQTKMFTQMAAPVVQQLQQKQQLLETTVEMKNLFERHPDAKDLDGIGRNGADASDRNPSLLEIAMYYAVDQQHKSIEEGYQLAKRWADAIGSKEKQTALGLIQDKKDAVTAAPSTSQTNQSIVEVQDAEELVRRNMEALASGQKPPRFVIKR